MMNEYKGIKYEIKKANNYNMLILPDFKVGYILEENYTEKTIIDIFEKRIIPNLEVLKWMRMKRSKLQM